ncbi:GntR family transcriptional regulator [Cupriavidus sp. USMAA2-4]|uniref:GntR family transcriptional regulator n=1 Tax=Cupriavidus malaysiensis TaxID=367825 RepID=A0ABM6F0V9_9BURK|nr:MULTISPECIES: alpha/beta fold hydrolase [Cupriavidus]AOY91833.1 GntR family transcriptional regulator [Cupriavidus sp. USMAA2-4]AOY98608.1 GntR family transcriptional regulator [Cupriavidus sp. USMAHM13]AOZ05038.1 GntR family transcriptional regulator [Cupriavidus malaysiensis]
MSSTTPPPTERIALAGPAGHIDVLRDAPVGPMRGVAVVAHPHPELGGTALHKVPQQLARALQSFGFLTLRPNFRGVGRSEGTHDQGIGETEDLLAVVASLRAAHPDGELALAGFSFGAFVQSHVAGRLVQAGVAIHHLILAGIPAGAIAGRRDYDTPAVPAHALVVHGERDETVPLGHVFEWARPQQLPVVVIPGADHFFSGRLPVLRGVAERYLRRPPEAA